MSVFQGVLPTAIRADAHLRNLKNKIPIKHLHAFNEPPLSPLSTRSFHCVPGVVATASLSAVTAGSRFSHPASETLL